MAEQLEQSQGQPAAEMQAEATTPAVNGVAQETTAPAEIPEWKQELNRIQEAHQREIKALQEQNLKLQHGMDKTFGKLRQKVTGIKQVVDTLVPEPKREQFKSDAEYQQAQEIVKPIRNKILENEQAIEKAEREAEEQAERDSYIQAIGGQLQTLPQEDSARILGKYNQALSRGQDYDIDKDMLAFVAHSGNGVKILDTLYDNPDMVASLKRMSLPAKMAALVNISMSAGNIVNAQAAPSLQPVAAQTKVAPPTMPKQTSGGGAKKPIYASSAQEYLALRMGRK